MKIKKIYPLSSNVLQLTCWIMLVLMIGTHTRAVAQSWVLQGNALAGQSTNASFGRVFSLSADGKTLAVYSVDLTSGRIQSYTWNGTAWLPIGNILVVPKSNSNVQIALSADGNTLAATFSNIAQVWAWNGSSWIGRGTVFSDAHTIDLSADGLTVIIAGVCNIVAPPCSAPVKIFTWNGTDWVQKGTDIIAQRSLNSVSINNDGNVIAFGQILGDEISGNFGQVKAYIWNGADWMQRGQALVGNASGDKFGVDISLNSTGEALVVGAQGLSYKGEVRIFDWNGTTWTPKGAHINGEGDEELGLSVDISADGNTVVAGARFASSWKPLPGGMLSYLEGLTRAYHWDGTNWTQLGDDIYGDFISDLEGYCVSISADGRSIATAAPAHSSFGRVRVFELETVGIQDAPFNAVLSIYPNPTQGNLTIQLGETYTNVTLTLTNVLGQVILTKAYDQTDVLQLEWEGAPGMYTFYLSTAEGNVASGKVYRRL